MAGDKRRSARLVPILSDEEVVMIESAKGGASLAKILDISDGGVLTYVVESRAKLETGTACKASFYHKGRVFAVQSKVTRNHWRMIGLEFTNVTPRLASQIRAKIASLEESFMKPKADS